MKRFMIAMVALVVGGMVEATMTEATTAAFRLSIKHDGIRESGGDEALTYSSLWDGDANATVTIAQDGESIAEGLTGEDTYAWGVTRNGTYVLTHTTYTNGVAGAVETATFVVTGKDVPFAPGDVTVTGYSEKYDGAAHGVTVASEIEGFAVKYCDTQDGEFAAEAPTLTDVGSMTVWCELSAPGYITETNSATVTISKREVTLTSESDSKVYDGAALVKHEVVVGGDGFAANEGATYDFTGSQTGVGESENTFAYTLNDGTKAGNYTISTVNGTLTVTKATVGPGGGGSGGGEEPDEPGDGDVPAGGASKFDVTVMYDGEGHTIDTNALFAAFGAAMIGDVAAMYGRAPDEPGGPIAWTATAPTFTNVGECVVWYKVTNPNYEDFMHSAKVTITNRLVTVNITGHSATHTYDTTEKSVSGYEATTEDALYDIAADTAFGGAALAARTDVGTTAMGLTASDFSNNNANFAVTYAVTDGGLTINPRVIGDNPANWDIRLGKSEMYDGTEKTAPIIQVCYVKPDSNLDNIPYALSGNTATNAGNYVVSITGTGNYAGTIEKDWAIMPRNVTLTSGSANWTYDGAPHSQTAISVTGDGFVAGEGASYSGFPVVTHVADAATPIANAFSYTLNAGTKAGNYAITTANGTVQMTPRAITLTAPTKSKPYDGQPLTFAANEVSVSGDGYANGESFALSGFSSITEAGRVDATFAVADGTALMGDYAITAVPGSLTVTKSATEITVTAKSGSWTYDGAAHTLHEYEATNLGTLIAGDVLDVTFSDDSVVTTPVDGVMQDGVVENTITSVRVMRGSTDVTANYTLAAYPGTLTVTKRPVTLTSKSDTKVYDGTPLTAHEVNVGGDGFVGADGAIYSFTGTQTDKGTSKNTFAYTLKSGTNALFYEIAKVEGDLEVTALDISEGTAGDWAIAFGQALTYTGLEQIQTLSSVTYKGLPLDCSVTGNAQTDAGTYQMTLTGQGNFTGEHAVEWSIAPKALTLTAPIKTKVYDGNALLNFAATAEGFVAGEGVLAACSGSITDVGSCESSVIAIYWDGKTKASNYAVTKVKGMLTVTPRPVTIRSKNISKPYDGTPLALTSSDIVTDGMVSGERFYYYDFADRTEAGQTSGTFSIAEFNGSKLSNYNITPIYGTITITKSATAISVTAASGEWVYDGETHSNRTWTATNLSTLQSGDALEVTFDPASVVTTPQDGPAQNGIVANVITGVRVMRGGTTDVTANYTVEWFPSSLTVTKRPVTVTVTGHTATHTYDGTEKTVTGYDIATEDTLYDISADTAFNGSDEVKRTDAGKTDMGLSAGDFANGNDCFEVTYAVTDGWVKIAPADISTDDTPGDFSLVLGANPKYNGTVQTIPVESATYKGLPVTYTLAGENATHAGTFTLTVKGNGNFTGERSTTWQMLKRVVTLTSGSANKVYDGTPLANGSVVVGGDGFIGLEGATFEVTGSQTGAGTSKNTFAYTLKAGTLAGDYDITKVEGDLVVTKAKYPGQEPGGAGIQWGVAADAATWMYDGQPHGVTLTGVPSGVTPHLVGNTATDAGSYTASVTFDYDAANYEPPVAPAPLAWSITKRPVTLMAPTKTKPYDGSPLTFAADEIAVGGDGFAEGESFDFSNFATITDAGRVDSTFDYAAEAGTTLDNYDVACVTGTLTVTKATIGPGGGGEPEEPGSGTVPVGGNSKFDASATYDGEGHTIDTNALAAAFAAAIIGEATVGYALDNGSDAPALPWVPTAPAFTNAGEYVVWYKVTNPNYDDFVHKAKVTIAQRDIANATIAPIADIVYAGVAVEPVPVVTDGAPSIIAATDYTVSYTENNAPGTATVTLTGQGNYTGTKSATFEILSPVKKAVLDALGGKIGGASVVTQECTAVYGALPSATREDYVFDGWFLGVTNGAPQATSGGALLVDDDHALFAKWSVSAMPGVVAPTLVVEAIDGGTCRITGLGDMTGTKLVIPDYIGGLAVTEIAVGAFANLTNGLAEVVFPTFCTNIGDKAFLSIKTLTSVKFANARRWDNPSLPAAVRVGAYAFAGTALGTVVMPDCIATIGDYVFANCQVLSSMTILGHPSIGLMPFRRSGYGTASGVEVHLDPALAGDDAFMEALKQQCEKVTVNTDAVVTGVAVSSLSLSPRKVKLTVSVERASSWGEVDTGSVRVNFRASLGDAPVSLVPDSVTENQDGSLTVEVVAPEGSSGFFQATICE